MHWRYQHHALRCSQCPPEVRFVRKKVCTQPPPPNTTALVAGKNGAKESHIITKKNLCATWIYITPWSAQDMSYAIVDARKPRIYNYTITDIVNNKPNDCWCFWSCWFVDIYERLRMFVVHTFIVQLWHFYFEKWKTL